MPRALNRRDLSNARFRELVDSGQAVYVGRPRKWGNPFVLGKDGNREEVIAKYMSYLSNEMIAQAQKELKGKHLICWCSPQTCHADVLLRAANREFAK